ncbi:4656_t:CDS:2, partial [Gigaspora margarita]
MFDPSELKSYLKKYKGTATYDRFLMSCNCETLLVAFQQEIETVTWEEVHRYWAVKFINTSKKCLSKDDHLKVKKTAGKNKKKIETFLNDLIELEKENLVPESSTGDLDSSVETSLDTSSDSDSKFLNSDDSDPSVKTHSDLDSDSSPNRLDIFEILKIAIRQFKPEEYNGTSAFKTTHMKLRGPETRRSQARPPTGLIRDCVGAEIKVMPQYHLVGKKKKKKIYWLPDVIWGLMESHFERALEYKRLLCSDEGWVMYFMCQNSATKDSYWSGNKELHEGLQ